MKQIVNQKIDQYKDSDPDKAKDWQNAGLVLDMLAGGRSEERRVGKECRSRWSPYH